MNALCLGRDFVASFIMPSRIIDYRTSSLYNRRVPKVRFVWIAWAVLTRNRELFRTFA
jgi:hypothetical protein